MWLRYNGEEIGAPQALVACTEVPFQCDAWSMMLPNPANHHPQAGLVSREDAEQLLIALEPEAASVYCRKLRLHQLVDLSSRAPGRGCLGERPGSQSLSRGEAKDSALLSSCDGYLLEPTEWPKGSQASCGVWREDSGLLSRPCRKRRPTSRDDGVVSWVFSSCSASVGFLMRYYGELREPLMCRLGSQVSMRIARGSASLL